jgi:hypothetical protein
MIDALLLSRHALMLGRAETSSFQRVSARCPSGIDMSIALAKSMVTSAVMSAAENRFPATKGTC